MGLPTVLIGEFSCGKSPMSPYLERHGWGRMWARDKPQWEYPEEPWAFDNGAFTAWRKGLPFPRKKWYERIIQAIKMQPHDPIMAVVPDIVGDPESLSFSTESYDCYPSTWPNYLAIQDGMKWVDVEYVIKLKLFKGLFLGGSDDFKKTAIVWAELAHDNGIPFHFARCNREAWLDLALRVEADSIDTARPVRELSYGTEKGIQWFKRFEQITTGNCPQKRLELI